MCAFCIALVDVLAHCLINHISNKEVGLYFALPSLCYLCT